MIISITPNPSIDISYFIDDFQQGNVHRVFDMVKVPGGKGLNVAKVLSLLGTCPECTGFLGGLNGEYIRRELKKRNIRSHFIPIEGETRSCFTISDRKNSIITEIRENGPTVTKRNVQTLMTYLQDKKNVSDIFSCSGSLPNGLDVTFYDELLDTLQDKITVLDLSGDNLRHVIFRNKNKPTAIKPNFDEIRDLFGEEVDRLSPIELLKHPSLQKIAIVILSLGKDGCVAKINENYYECHVPDIHAVNPVGSGDASLAGLCYGLEQKFSAEDILKISMACGVLNTLEEKIGHIDKSLLKPVMNQIIVRKVHENI